MSSDDLHIHRVGYMKVERRPKYCPTCEKEADSLIATPDNPHYPPEETCLECGDRWWGNGDMMPRPFLRGWREKSKSDALAFWEKHGEFDHTEDHLARWEKRGL